MKAVLMIVLLTIAAVLGAGWYTDMTVKQGVGVLAERVGMPMPGLTGSDEPMEATDDTALIDAANALDQQFVDAFNAGDADAVAALFWNSPEVVSYPPDAMQARGIDAIKAGWAQALEATPGATLELTESNQFVVGDGVVGHGTFTMTVPVPDEEPTTILGRFTDVKAERDGTWVYLVDHGSVPIPPPPS